MGIFGGGGNKSNRAAEKAAKDIFFQPQDLELGGIGGVDATRVGDRFNVDLSLDDRVAGLQNLLFGQADPALAGAAQGIGPQAGASTAALANAARVQGAFGSFDPLEAARQQFEQIDSLLQPGRARETAGLESRLFRQGRLESTAGNNLMAERAAQIERERGLLAAGQLQSAQQAQGNLAQTGQTLAQTGAGLSEGLFNRGVAGGQAGQQLSLPLMNLLAMSGDLGSQHLQGQIARSGAINQFNAGQDTTGGFERILGGVVEGAVGALPGLIPGGGLATSLSGAFGGGSPGSSASQIRRNQR